MEVVSSEPSRRRDACQVEGRALMTDRFEHALASPAASCMALGESRPFAEPQFPHL